MRVVLTLIPVVGTSQRHGLGVMDALRTRYYIRYILVTRTLPFSRSRLSYRFPSVFCSRLRVTFRQHVSTPAIHLQRLLR